MNTALIVALIPLLIELIKMMEKVFNKGKAGAEKKAAVEQGVSSIFDGITAISTGGQKETLEAVKPLVGPMIDIFASQLFPKEDR